MFENTGRHVGVAVPPGQSQGERGSPQTVSDAVRCNMVATRFFDEYGREHHAVLLEVGNQLYMPPNSETWAAALKQCAPWLFEGVKRQLRAAEAVAPATDTVDIVDEAAAKVAQETA